MKPSKKNTPQRVPRSEPTPQEINMLVALFNQARYAEMEALAREMTARFPLYGFCWKAMGTALLQQGRNEEAVAPLQRAAELSQGDAQPHNNLGNTLVKLGRLPEAEASYRRALELNPGFVEAQHNLGNTLLGLDRLPEAEASYRLALKINPNFVEAHNSLGNILLKQGRLHAAEACYRRALELKPDFAEAHNNLGNTLLKLGRFAEAETCYRRVLEIKPDYAEAYSNLGVILNEQEHPSKAEASLRRALALNPDFAEAHYNLGIALQSQCRLLEAEASYRQALWLRPDYAEAYSRLGFALGDQGRLAEAEACLRQALEIEPGFVEAYSKLVNILQDQGRPSEASECIRDMVNSIVNRSPQDHTDPGTATPITALLPLGRAGSIFFHSLFDGHPELATLPGIYFKGWFGHDVWERFAPNTAEPKWRERLAGLIVTEFQPLFDARSHKNVVGTPFGNSDWLAMDSGFMDMGTDRSQPFVVDQSAFAAAFLSLLAPLPSVSQKACFELIHRAFEVAIRGNIAGGKKGGQIFYHLHNPEIFEFAHFLHHYPQARLLYIVRNPVQGMESWMLLDVDGEAETIASLKDADANSKLELDYLLKRWNKAVDKVMMMFKQLRSPFNTLAISRGVRLEDVKRDTKHIMPQIAAWMGITDHPALYEASFCGLQYWGPASKVTGKITGFDTRAIDRPVGRLLGPRDIQIFETLFWPFSRLYGYTDLDAADFRRQLAEIRPWLDEPLEFEKRLYAELPDHTRAMEELPPYSRLHRLLRQTWAVLDRDGTYYGMVQPLELE